MRSEPRTPLSTQEADPDRLPFGLRSDAICTIPWTVKPFEAVMVFADLLLMDRAGLLCEEINVLTTTHGDLDSLSDALRRLADVEGLTVSIYEEPRDDISRGVLAVTFTIADGARTTPLSCGDQFNLDA
jgi:hypothetical protein